MPDDAVEIQFQLHPQPRLHAEDHGGGQPGASAGRLPRVTQVLALAICFQDMVKRGEAKDYADLARLGGVTRERLSQIMKLVWLAPDVVQEVLYLPPTPGGQYPVSELAMRKIANMTSWAEQRRLWKQVKESQLLV